MDIPKFPSKLACLACFIFLFTTINQSLSARTLSGPPPPQPQSHHRHHHNHPSITFYMPNVLNNTHPSSRPATTKVNGQLPFSKPLGIFPPIGGIPLSSSINPTNTIPTSEFSNPQTLDLPGIGITIPATATLQEELELGMVTPIEVDLLQSPSIFGTQLVVGKAKGMYVASSEDGNSQMMAMITNFLENKSEDGLWFFGLHWLDVHSESHIAIIGGTGKFDGANGYATIKTIKINSKTVDKEEGYGGDMDFLRFNVYLG